MNKLRVINPFFTLEFGDILELDQDGENYTAEHNEEFDRASTDGGVYKSSLKSTFTISKDYAKELIADGYLEEFKESQATSNKFVNIFDEIDNLLKQYQEELDTIDDSKESVPMCVKVEKTTVLSNLIKVLTHLKNLKK